jgi:hypothetical protein
MPQARVTAFEKMQQAFWDTGQFHRAPVILNLLAGRLGYSAESGYLHLSRKGEYSARCAYWPTHNAGKNTNAYLTKLVGARQAHLFLFQYLQESGV